MIRGKEMDVKHLTDPLLSKVFVWWSMVLICWGVVLGAVNAVAQQQDSVGQVVALEGKATVRHKGDAQSKLLRLQSPVYPEDFIQTRTASRLKLVLVDGTVLTLGEQGGMKISAFVYSPQSKTRKSLLQVIEGTFRAVVKKLLPQSTFEVHTPNAVAAVRGTDWLGQVGRDATGIIVLQGAVVVTHRRPEIQGEVFLTASMGTDVIGNEPPSLPKQWGKGRVQAMVEATKLP